MLQPLAAVCGVHIATTCGISGLHQSQSTGHQRGWLALGIQREPFHSAQLEKSQEWIFLLEEDLHCLTMRFDKNLYILQHLIKV